ncbi:uncharacterized protein LOC143607078 [Bidens hawaiensis]|uniref:uncharacterized protein LOC143607078 n=1 Tax=Bidens hawaiensis TaxID=980011 RepID=UPI00404B99B9
MIKSSWEMKRSGDMRWGSHYNSVCSLLNMFSVTHVVLEGIIEDLSHTTFAQRGDADTAYGYMKSFEFVFILHLMKEILGRIDTLSQALQKKTQDIHNAMECHTSTLDKQLHELDSRFNDHMMELLSLSSSLASKKINVDEICLLVEKYYLEYFTELERTHL